MPPAVLGTEAESADSLDVACTTRGGVLLLWLQEGEAGLRERTSIIF